MKEIEIKEIKKNKSVFVEELSTEVIESLEFLGLVVQQVKGFIISNIENENNKKITKGLNSKQQVKRKVLITKDTVLTVIDDIDKNSTKYKSLSKYQKNALEVIIKKLNSVKSLGLKKENLAKVVYRAKIGYSSLESASSIIGHLYRKGFLIETINEDLERKPKFKKNLTKVKTTFSKSSNLDMPRYKQVKVNYLEPDQVNKLTPRIKELIWHIKKNYDNNQVIDKKILVLDIMKVLGTSNKNSAGTYISTLCKTEFLKPIYEYSP